MIQQLKSTFDTDGGWTRSSGSVAGLPSIGRCREDGGARPLFSRSAIEGTAVSMQQQRNTES